MRCRHSSQTPSFTSLQWIQLTREGQYILSYSILFIYLFIYPSERHQRQHEALLQRVCSLKDEWIQPHQLQVLLKKWIFLPQQRILFFHVNCQAKERVRAHSLAVVQISCNKFRPVMPAGDHPSKKNTENKAIMYIQH